MLEAAHNTLTKTHFVCSRKSDITVNKQNSYVDNKNLKLIQLLWEMSEVVRGQVVGGDAGAEVWECVGAAMCWVEGREGCQGPRWEALGGAGAWRRPVRFCRIRGEAGLRGEATGRDAALFSKCEVSG